MQTAGTARPALGGVGQVRARCRPVRDRPGHRPVRRVAARDVSRSGGARRCRRRARRGPPATRAVHGRAHHPGQPDPRNRAAAPTSCPALLDPIGYTVSGDGDTRRVALPSWRPDSEAEIDVVEEVARHYGYDRIGKTVPKSIVHGRLSETPGPPPPAPRGVARARHLRGDAEPVPRARHAGEGGSRQYGADDQQPARRRGERAADVAAARTAARDRVQRVAPPNGRRVVRDRPRLPAGRR